MKTGYFARATEEGHRAKFTQVHIVDDYDKPLCGYKPHKTMQFYFCSIGVYLPYIECKRCKVKLFKRRKNEKIMPLL